MKLTAEVTIKHDGTLCYQGRLAADKEPITDLTALRLEVLSETHKAIEEAVAKINNRLIEKGIEAKLAICDVDEFGNPLLLNERTKW